MTDTTTTPATTIDPGPLLPVNAGAPGSCSTWIKDCDLVAQSPNAVLIRRRGRDGSAWVPRRHVFIMGESMAKYGNAVDVNMKVWLYRKIYTQL